MAVELRVAEADAQIADVESEKEMARLAAADRARSRLEDIVSRERDLAVKVTDVRNHIANLQTRLANADVFAPHDGVIRNVRFSVPGAKVTEGDILFDVRRTDQTYLVEVVAPAAALPPIEAGDGAQVKPGLRNIASVRSIRAVVDGITDGEEDAGASKGSTRTVYVAVAEDSVPLDERNKFRTGSSVRVTIDVGAAVAGDDLHSARHKPARG
jgi:multidrug resistance efflux pump